MSMLRNVMILASAGSGKTYALTSRFVALLAAGASPERIVALTFTRKAAGEFFDEILRKLAKAAKDEEVARELAGEIGQPQLGRADFLRLLRVMVDAMHRLRLGTLDSFFARIARTFPMELGLAGEFELLQAHAAMVERRRVLRRMFARNGAGAPDAAQAEFIEAFKRATFGAEEKQLGARLDGFLDRFQENFLGAPDAAQWGDPLRIWPDGSPWLTDDIRLGEAVTTLRTSLPALTPGQSARWDAFLAAVTEWRPGAPLSKPLEYLLNNALAVWTDVLRGEAQVMVDRRKLPLSRDACRALERIVRHVIGGELKRRIETTRGIHAVLRAYEANYHQSVRRAGRLTFADVQRLLMPVTLTGRAGDDGAVEDAGDRLFLDYRLDAEINHWLLDEFQDTSFGQWSVLRNLIDEAVQDAEGRRSFFCVGDIKQAIYSWREGDPRLFREIFDHYNAATPGTIAEDHLIASWRSGPALIEMVNAVFGNAAVLTELFPGAASAMWNREWRAHTSAVPKRTGHAALLHAEDERQRWDVVRRLLEEIRPVERGLSCAILVRRNDIAAALADELRFAGIAALAESDLHIATDNPLGSVLLALLQAVAHPGDTLAREHVRMTPLETVLAADGLSEPDRLTEFVLGQVHSLGFEQTVEHWVARLEPALAPEDQFSRQRAREFTSAAGLFDQTGSRDIGEFIDFMEKHCVRPPAGDFVVRVMTIHKSKGLGFDVVIVPDLEGNRIDERRDGLAVQKAGDRSVQWILDLPPKPFFAQDEVLAAHVKDAEADACHESLSLLYVALTRAKRAMYVITEPVGDSKSRNFPKLLASTLGEDSKSMRVGSAVFLGAWSSGDPDWHVAVERGASAQRDEAFDGLVPIDVGETVRLPRYPARRASGTRRGRARLARLFAPESSTAAELGTAVHARLAEIEWATAADSEHWAARWREAGEDRAVVDLAIACLRASGAESVWRRPLSPIAEVWRERAFEIVLDGVWLTGVFDRVVVECDEKGRALRAAVYDFKTDRIGDGDELANAVQRHSEQLDLYRRVVAVLTGLPTSDVHGRLVFARAGHLV